MRMHRPHGSAVGIVSAMNSRQPELPQRAPTRSRSACSRARDARRAPPRVSRAARLAARRAASFKSLALAHADGKRWLLVGPRQRARTSRPSAPASPPRWPRDRARELSTRTLCWELPDRAGRRPWPARSSRARCSPTTASSAYKSRRPSEPDAPPKHLEGADRRRRRRCRADRRRRRDRRRGGQRARATCRTAPPTTSRRRRSANTPGARRARSTALPVEVEGRDSIDRARHGRLRGRRPGLRAGARADHAALRGPERTAGRRSASSARRSRSTAAASR